MEPTSEPISDAEWDVIAAIPTISKLLNLPPGNAGKALADQVVGMKVGGMKVGGMEGADIEGDVFLLYAGEESPWMVHRRKGCKCSHLHVAFRQF